MAAHNYIGKVQTFDKAITVYEAKQFANETGLSFIEFSQKGMDTLKQVLSTLKASNKFAVVIENTITRDYVTRFYEINESANINGITPFNASLVVTSNGNTYLVESNEVLTPKSYTTGKALYASFGQSVKSTFICNLQTMQGVNGDIIDLMLDFGIDCESKQARYAIINSGYYDLVTC